MMLEIFKYITNVIDEKFPVYGYAVTQGGKIRWANTRLLELTEASNLKAVKGKHVSIYIGEKEWLKNKRIMELKKSEILYENANNKDFFTLKIPCTQGGFRGLVGLSIDITALKQAETAKQEFLMNMNHDIRTPFCGIIGIFGLLHMGENDPEKKKWLKMGLESSKRLLNFMIDVRELSELGHLPLDYETFGITQMADDVLLFLEATVKSRGLGVIKHYDGDMVYSNPFRIKHILLNLLGNAIKFTEKGGINFSIKTTPNLVIMVQDSGIGIDTQYHEKIFEECFKVKPSYKNSDYAGVGKGLYLVKNYVKDLQGKVTVQSSANEGATFIVEIPSKLEQAAT